MSGVKASKPETERESGKYEGGTFQLEVCASKPVSGSVLPAPETSKRAPKTGGNVGTSATELTETSSDRERLGN